MCVRALLIALAAALLAACKRDREPAPPPPPPSERCLADEIGHLRDGWKVLEDCERDRTACHDDCVNGDGDSCFNLAVAVQQDNPARDKATISDYFERACRAGLATGCVNWAAGQWIADKKRPRSHCLYRVFDMGCDAGDPFGCSMTARMLVEEPLTPADTWIGYSRLINACDRFEGPPCVFLGWFIERGKFGAPDPLRVKALLERACRTGVEDACGKSKADEWLH